MKNENGEIVTENSIDMFSKNYNKTYFKKLIKELLNNIDVKKMEIYFVGGFSENSFSSAILCGTVESSIQTIYSILSQKYDCVKLYDDVSPTFNENNLELTFDIVVSISLFKIFLSIIKAAFANTKLKEGNNER